MKNFLIIIFFFSVCMQAQEIREVKGKTICCDAAGNTLTADVIESRANTSDSWRVLSADYDGADGDCEYEPTCTGILKGDGGVEYTFACYNLGTDKSHDAMIPGWQLNGTYYQWNRKNPVARAPEIDNDDPGVIGTWDSFIPSGTEWESAKDPCPDGYSVPSKAVWDEVIKSSNNTWYNVGTWSNSSSNFSSGKMVRPNGTSAATLFLPSSGLRNYNTGLLSLRGTGGYYWSSTQYDPAHAYRLDFAGVSNRYVRFSRREYGFSVRCLAD